MLNDERQFNREDIHIILCKMIKTYSRDEYHDMLELVRLVELFQEKCHKLAWTLLNTINNVHYYHFLNNDMSPNYVM
jgi:hypothetical protein